jgi:hypothetical protein
MRTWLIGIAVVVVSAALGVGAAYGGNAVLENYRAQHPAAVRTVPNQNEWRGNGGMPARYRQSDEIRQRVRDRIEVFQGTRSGNKNPKR